MIPRPNRTEIIKMNDKIEKKQAGMLFDLSSSGNLRMDRWKTGIDDLDDIIGGGMPYGRIGEIYGAESSGKTSLLYHLLAQHDLAMDLPIEGTFDAERARAFGCRGSKDPLKGLKIYRGQIGEDTMNKMLKCVRAGYPIVGLDSVYSLRPKEDIDKLVKNADNDKADALRLGGTARLLGQRVPTINDFAEQTGTTVIFVNQTRKKFGATNPFADNDNTPGGDTIRFYASLRLKVARRAWIDIKNYNPAVTAGKERIGMIMKIKVVKSKICNPLGECEVPMLFDKGFVSFADLKGLIKDIEEERKEFYKHKNNQKVNIDVDDWDDEGDENDDWD